MGRHKKIDVSDLKQTNGQIQETKTVKEVVASKNVSTEEVKTVSNETQAIVKEEDKAYVAHGALTPEQTNSVVSILKRFKKNSGFDKYNEPKEYSSALRSMTLTELHAHAVEVAIIPTSDKEKLIKNLEYAFGVYINKQIPKVFPASNLTVKGAKQIEAIIAKKLGKTS